MRLFLTRSESAALRRCIALLGVSRSGFALSLLLGVVALGSAIALGGTAAWLIARASQQPPVLYLTVAATSVRLFGLSRALARYLSRLASHKVALEGMDNLRANLYDRLSSAPAAALSSVRRGDLMSRAGADVDEVGNVVVKTVLPALVALIVGVATVAVVAVISPASALVLALCLLLSAVVAPTLIARSVRMAEGEGGDARADIAATTLALLEGATELSLAGTLPAATQTLARSEASLRQALARSARLSALARGLDVSAVGMALIAALLIGIPHTLSGALPQVLLAVIVLIPLSSFEGVAELAPAASQLVRSAQAAQRICALIGEEFPSASHAIPEAATLIEAHDLAIGWPGGPTLVEGITFTLRPGASVAIVDHAAGHPHGSDSPQVRSGPHQRGARVGGAPRRRRFPHHHDRRGRPHLRNQHLRESARREGVPDARRGRDVTATSGTRRVDRLSSRRNRYGDRFGGDDGIRG